MPKSPKNRIITTKEKPEDKTLDLTLRPRTIKEFIGQEKVNNFYE